MKKLLVGFIATMLVAGSMPAVAFATTTPSTADLIAQLTAQIATLQAKIAELKTAQGGVQSSAQDVRTTLRLIGDLKEGMTSEEVKLLQALLASDADLYPEKSVTGYYGKLTAKAIKRFQKKHGLPETGFTGPMTRAKLNELLANAPIAKESSDDDEDEDRDDDRREGRNDDRRGNGRSERFCLNVPPGHLVAKGWQKNHGDDKQKGKWEDDTTLPICKRLPPGIEKQLGNGSTTPPAWSDKVAPTVSPVGVSSIVTTGATLSWTTNELALSKVYVSTVSPVATVTPTWVEGAKALNHSTTLAGLQASTTYYVLVSATDASGNTSFGATKSFTTAPVVAPDTTAPVISALDVANIASTSASVTWTTNESAGSKVYYGTSTPLNTGIALNVFSATLVTGHNVALTGLSASTTYYVIAESKDTANNVGTSSQTSFTTL